MDMSCSSCVLDHLSHATLPKVVETYVDVLEPWEHVTDIVRLGVLLQLLVRLAVDGGKDRLKNMEWPLRGETHASSTKLLSLVKGSPYGCGFTRAGFTVRPARPAGRDHRHVDM